jgi:hypothetical protein
MSLGYNLKKQSSYRILINGVRILTDLDQKYRDVRQETRLISKLRKAVEKNRPSDKVLCVSTNKPAGLFDEKRLK